MEQRDDVDSALSLLSSEDRHIIQLWFYEDLCLKAIAAQLDISLSAAKMRLYRAIDKVKRAYRGLDPEQALQSC